MDRPDLTSEKAVKEEPSLSSVSPASSVTLSKITLASSPGKVKRIIAAWSVGAISAFTPFSNRTP